MRPWFCAGSGRGANVFDNRQEAVTTSGAGREGMLFAGEAWWHAGRDYGVVCVHQWTRSCRSCAVVREEQWW